MRVQRCTYQRTSASPKQPCGCCHSDEPGDNVTASFAGILFEQLTEMKSLSLLVILDLT